MESKLESPADLMVLVGVGLCEGRELAEWWCQEMGFSMTRSPWRRSPVEEHSGRAGQWWDGGEHALGARSFCVVCWMMKAVGVF